MPQPINDRASPFRSGICVSHFKRSGNSRFLPLRGWSVEEGLSALPKQHPFMEGWLWLGLGFHHLAPNKRLPTHLDDFLGRLGLKYLGVNQNYPGAWEPFELNMIFRQRTLYKLAASTPMTAGMGRFRPEVRNIFPTTGFRGKLQR